jgi:hypothetical protein
MRSSVASSAASTLSARRPGAALRVQVRVSSNGMVPCSGVKGELVAPVLAELLEIAAGGGGGDIGV